MIILPNCMVFMVKLQCILYLFFSGIASESTFTGNKSYSRSQPSQDCYEDDPIPPPVPPPQPPKCTTKRSWDISRDVPKCLGKFHFSHAGVKDFSPNHFDGLTKNHFIIT